MGETLTKRVWLLILSFQDPFTKEWFEVSEAVAREKVGQQIRENMNRKKSGFKSASSAMRKRKSCSDDSSCQSEESEKSEVSSRRQSVESCNSESSELAVYSSQQCVSHTNMEQTTPDHTQIKESRQISPVSVANMAEWPQHQLSNMSPPLLEAEVWANSSFQLCGLRSMHIWNMIIIWCVHHNTIEKGVHWLLHVPQIDHWLWVMFIDLTILLFAIVASIHSWSLPVFRTFFFRMKQWSWGLGDGECAEQKRISCPEWFNAAIALMICGSTMEERFPFVDWKSPYGLFWNCGLIDVNGKLCCDLVESPRCDSESYTGIHECQSQWSGNRQFYNCPQKCESAQDPGKFVYLYYLR